MAAETGFMQKLLGFWQGIRLDAVLWGILGIAVSICAALLINRILSFIIKRLFARNRHGKDPRKVETLRTLAQSAAHYVIWFLCAATILDILGLGATLTSLLATAGIGGVAIGLGAQSLLKDIITGFFMLFDDQFSVGDMVTIDGTTGTVESVALRTTSLRVFTGELVMIPNGQITKISNLSRGNSLAVVDCLIAYESDTQRALDTMERVARLFDGDEALVEPAKVLGVIQLGERQVQLRMVARTHPLGHWEVERRMRAALLEEMRRDGIDMRIRELVIKNPEA